MLVAIPQDRLSISASSRSTDTIRTPWASEYSSQTVTE